LRQEPSLYLDVVRFSAAMVVFLGHAAGRWQLGAYLHTAVIVFFVLSGFVIGFVASTKERTLDDYWAARIARRSSIVVPALLLTLVCDVIGLSLNRGFYVNGPWGYPSGSQVANYLPSLFLLQNVWELDLNPVSTSRSGR
jgi:peptidoglycan/LPS O-acetylase OafA/YrhL